MRKIVFSLIVFCGFTLMAAGQVLQSSAKFYWRKISGPSCYIVSPFRSTTVVKKLKRGIYFFEFKVVFKSGSVARDTVKVTVLPAKPLN